MSPLHRRAISSTRPLISSDTSSSRTLGDLPPFPITTNRSKGPRRLLRHFVLIVRRHPILKGPTPFRIVCFALFSLLLYLISSIISYIRTPYYPPLVAPLTLASRPLWERHQLGLHRVIPTYEALDLRRRQRLEESSMKRLRNIRKRLTPLVAKKAPLDDGTEVEEVKPARKPEALVEVQDKVPKPARKAKPADLQHVRIVKDEALEVDNMDEVRTKPKPKGKGKPKLKPKGGKSKNRKQKGSSSGKKRKGKKKANKTPK